MSDLVQETAKCWDPGDGSGDVVIELPPDVLAAMKVGLSDRLSIELVAGLIVLKPIRDAETKSCG